VISYQDSTNGDLKVAKCANAACTGAATLSTVDSVGFVGFFTAIAIAIVIGADGLPVISYWDATNNDLKVAKCANGACTGAATLSTVDSAGDVGWFTSIAIGADSLPVISYLDVTNGDLKVAKCANAACAPLRLRASLSGGQEVPPVASAAIGTASMTFNVGTNLLTWNITFDGLTGGFTAAHFHGPAQVGQEAPPVITIPGSASPLTGSATLTSAQAAELLASLWYINIHSGTYPDGEIRGQVVPRNTRADFNGDGRSDVLWRHTGFDGSGENYLYPMDGLTILGSEGYLRTVADSLWRIVGVGDFDGDGRSDILWRHDSSGNNYVYLMNGTSIVGEGYLRTVADPNWRVAGVGDLDGDGKDDILWRHTDTGENYV
jgi:hypothetical protein